MSTKLTAYVWDGCAAAGMKLSMVAIMARLADFSSDEGLCWPSVKTIARQIGASESTVSASLAKLEKDGWITRQQRRKGNRNTSSMTQLNVGMLQAAASSHPPKSEASKSEVSKFDASKFDPSESSLNGHFDPPESGDDPSVNSKPDPSGKKPTCQPAAQTDLEVLITDQAKKVLKHLNLVTGSRYQTSKSSLDNIRARLRDGFTVDQLVQTVDYLTAKWGGDLAMSDYLRPTTLFAPTKFPGYQQSSTAWDKKGRPACINGKWQTSTNHRVTPATGAIPPGFSNGLPTGGEHDGIVN
ncbi:TPA: conserved phage C-terminal domain-containing protein [Serratia marcescens]|nr:conserved phage C-terminal domain-containing protein [Serratia marcescens]HEJ7014406.1 conserved phage C-terminal domain-containing protein [Serratia marcescens]